MLSCAWKKAELRTEVAGFLLTRSDQGTVISGYCAIGEKKTRLHPILSVPLGTRRYPHSLYLLLDGFAPATTDAVFVKVHHRRNRSRGRRWSSARRIELLGNRSRQAFLNQVALLVFDL